MNGLRESCARCHWSAAFISWPDEGSTEFGAFLAAAATAFGAHQPSLLYIEAPPGQQLPFVKSRRAQRFAFGTLLFGSFQIDDVAHRPSYRWRLSTGNQCVIAYTTTFTPTMYERVENVSKYH